MPASQSEHVPGITILGSNLSGGGALACVTIARALRDAYRVQVMGPVFGPRLWQGLDPDELDVVTFPGGDFPRFYGTLRNMRASIHGDLVISYGLRLPSFGLGLLHRLLTGTPCILYVDEDDIALTMPGRQRPLRRRLASANGDLPTRLMCRLRKRADAIFCGSGVLSGRFGGTTAPLGRDPSRYDPGFYDRNKTRSECQIARDETVVGFMGNPRPHVGIEDLLASLELLSSDRYTLLVAPPGEASEYARSLFSRSKIKVKLLENEPSNRVPEFLHASDVVVVPQRTDEVGLGQTPARLVEAMAMGKPIVSTRLADIPDLLKDAGILVNDRSPQDIATALKWIDEHPAEAREMGRRARHKFLSDLTLQAMAEKMKPEIERLLGERRRR